MSEKISNMEGKDQQESMADKIRRKMRMGIPLSKNEEAWRDAKIREEREDDNPRYGH